MGELFRLACALKPEDVADARRRGNDQSELGRVGIGAKTDDGLVAAGHISFFAIVCIEPAEIRFAFLCVHRDDAAAISRPDRRIAAAATWRAVVSADA